MCPPRFVVIGLWALLALGVAAAVTTFGAQTNNDLSLPGTGSQEVKDLLEPRFPPQQNGVNPIVFDVSTGKLTDEPTSRPSPIGQGDRQGHTCERHQPGEQ